MSYFLLFYVLNPSFSLFVLLLFWAIMKPVQWSTTRPAFRGGCLVVFGLSIVLLWGRSRDKSSVWTNTQGLSITEEKALPLNWHLQQVRLPRLNGLVLICLSRLKFWPLFSWCAEVEKTPQLLKDPESWSGRCSNLRLPACQPDAQPTEPPVHGTHLSTLQCS